MSQTFERIRDLVAREEVRISEHGYEELTRDGILVAEVVAGTTSGEVVEDYPNFPKGPCVLVLQRDAVGPIHVVWGIPRNRVSPAVVVTAYRPDPEKWSTDFRRRRE